MNAATFQTIREGLGLNSDQAAVKLNVRERSIRLWETGRAPIPEGVAAEMWDMVDEFIDQTEKGPYRANTRAARAVAWAAIQTGEINEVEH